MPTEFVDRYEHGAVSHVVIVTDNLDVDGGAGKVALSSARAIAASGTMTTVFAATGNAVSEDRNLRFVSTGQGTFLEDPARLAAAARGIYNTAARNALRTLLSECDPQQTIVHVHSWTKALSASIFDAIADTNIPLVITLHEYFLACPTGSLYLHKQHEICHLRPMGVRCISTDCDSRNYSFKAYRVARQFVQRDVMRALGRRATLVTVSEFSKRILLARLPQGTAIRVLRNPIATRREPRVAAETNRPFVYVGRLSAEKGASIFAEAARTAGVEAVFIGDGEERAAIARVNREAQILGWLDSGRVADALRRARTIVMPSLWYETFGLVVLEGAALGIPAIVPAGTAPGELVRDGKTGSLFERGDAEDLGRKLRTHLDDELVKHLSENAYDGYWSDPADMERHLTAIFEIYAVARKNYASATRRARGVTYST